MKKEKKPPQSPKPDKKSGQDEFTPEQLKKIFEIAKAYEEKGIDYKMDPEHDLLTGDDLKRISKAEKLKKPEKKKK